MTKFKSKFGKIYKKYNKRPDGTIVDQATWTVRYKGKDHATGETDPKKAERFLLRLAGDLAHGDRPGALDRGQSAGAILMSELFDDLNANARRKSNATSDENEGRVNLRLRPFFGTVAASQLTTGLFEKYVDSRIRSRAANATINKELALLKRALRLAAGRTPPKVLHVPQIDLLKVQNARQGFFEPVQYVAMKACLPPYLVPLLVTGYHVGNRRGELLQVEFSDVEMDSEPPHFRLYEDVTKSGEGRAIPIYGEMLSVFRDQIAYTRQHYPTCSLLFHNEGQPILTFYKAWKTALRKAGLADNVLFHDLRRSAVRNLTKSGIHRKMAKTITGHKTDMVFDRYLIFDEDEMAESTEKAGEYLRKQLEKVKVGA